MATLKEQLKQIVNPASITKAVSGLQTAPEPVSYEQVMQLKAAGWEINDLPVKLNENGKRVIYDLEKINDQHNLGLSSEQINEAARIKSTAINTWFSERSEGDSGGTAAGTRALNDRQALLNNLSILDPLTANVDLTKSDHLTNLMKPGFMHGVSSSLAEDRLNQGQGPSGMGTWARTVVPALATAAIGAGAAGAAGVFGASPTLTGGAAAAGGTGAAGGVTAGSANAAANAAASAAGGSVTAPALGGGAAAAGGAGAAGAGLSALEAAGGIDAAGVASGGAGLTALEAAGGVDAAAAAAAAGGAGTAANNIPWGPIVAGGTAIAAGLSDAGDSGGGGSGSSGPLDITSLDFWNGFVDEWVGAKDKILEDDAFRKSKVEPAIGKYQQVLSDLTNQANTGTGTYKPTTFGMGDFRSSFVPKSGLMVAEDLKNYGKEDLTSELALTDVMQPNKVLILHLTETIYTRT
jgi:hypothetical protein